MPIVICQNCGDSFYIKPSHLRLGEGKFCSHACRGVAKRTGEYRHCEVCGKEVWKQRRDIKRSKSGKFFCNKSCQTMWRNVLFSGKNHPLWRGGKTVYRERMIRSSAKRICQSCGLDDIRVLDVHHIDHDKSNCELSNLVWLCGNCHFLVHNYGKDINGH